MSLRRLFLYFMKPAQQKVTHHTPDGYHKNGKQPQQFIQISFEFAPHDIDKSNKPDAQVNNNAYFRKTHFDSFAASGIIDKNI